MTERAANTGATAKESPKAQGSQYISHDFQKQGSKPRVAHQQDAARAGFQKPWCVQHETVLTLFVRSMYLFCAHPSSTES